MKHSIEEYEKIRLYLGQYTACKRRKKELKRRREDLEEEMKNPLQAAGYSAMPSGRKLSDGAASIPLMIAQIEDDLLAEQELMTKRLFEITQVISEVPSETRGRSILEFRFIDGMGWKTVCKKMYISKSQGLRDEQKALDRLLDMEWVRNRVEEYIEAS